MLPKISKKMQQIQLKIVKLKNVISFKIIVKVEAEAKTAGWMHMNDSYKRIIRQLFRM